MKHVKNTRKREQKTSLFFHEVSSLVQQLSLDEPELAKIFVTRVELSGDYRVCYVYFSTYGPKTDYEPALEILKLYKPSMRTALAKSIGGRYTTDLRFLYDEVKDKERAINKLLDEVVQDLPEQEGDEEE